MSLAKAKFHSLRGEKSALILVKANALCQSTAVYVPREGVNAFAGKELTDADKGLEFSIPDGFRTEPMVDVKTGEIRTATNGQPLLALVY